MVTGVTVGILLVVAYRVQLFTAIETSVLLQLQHKSI